jgi:3',5'-cyclic AMP phosphodiesterase CpdA
MKRDLQKLYAALTPDAPPSMEPRGLEARSPAGLEGIPGATAEHTPLLPEQLDQLDRLMVLAPDGVREFLGGTRGDKTITQQEALAMLADLRQALEQPASTEGQLEGIRARRATQPPPEGFSFDLYDAAKIPINPDRRDFQDDDWLGYGLGGGVNGALFHANLLPLGPIRRHEEHESGFTYELGPRDGKDLKIALLADFANGYYHARYIARRLAHSKYPYAIHLGDVYYAGTDREVRAYLEEPLREVLTDTELFLLSGNHEMYARGRPWLAYLDRKRQLERQRQEGTYFRLLRDGFQILGIDTEWFGHVRYQEPRLKLWLTNALLEGRREGRTNILLSSNEPYCYGKKETTNLYRDLKDVIDAGLIDLWFWGNTHYGALFKRSERFPFIGSCIGHGGYPYKRIEAGSPEPVATRFLEDGTRFGGGAWKDPRPDMGNNGFCEMILKADGTIQLVYLDWMGRKRHEAALARGADGCDFVGG